MISFMNMKDALAVGELTKGKVVAGKKGTSREVTAIEVMEVPEVASWVSPGVLVMTTFYSIKEDREKQVDIVAGLIEKEAAGIVIKLGRFVEEVPEAMKKLADEYSFPVITIPKDVSYISILTPLNEKLYKEKQFQASKFYLPLMEMEQADFSSLIDALDSIADTVQSPIYLEDRDGRLLHATKHFQGDEWRKDSKLFSTPAYEKYSLKLKKWHHEANDHAYFFFHIPGSRRRVILPLFWNGELFAFLHIIYVDSSMFQHAAPKHMGKIS